MPEIAQYVLSVVVIPAAIAAVLALPFVLKPLRERRVLAEGGVAFALMAAFVLSFTSELDWNAILRQIVTIPNDDAPFERWHRVGMSALGLAGVAWVVALARSGAASSRLWAGLAAVPAVSLGAAAFARFPGATLETQSYLAGLVVLAIVGFGGFARRVMLWSAWIAFGLLAFLAGEGGFASLAVMGGAMSAASFAIAALCWLGAWRARRARAAAGGPSDGRDAIESGPRGVATPIVLGSLAAVVAECGRACNTMEIPVMFWYSAALVPCAGVVAEIALRTDPNRRRPLVAFGAIFLAAAILVGWFYLWRARAVATESGGGSGSLDAYGGF